MQTDYIIAVGIFITIFAVMVLFTTSYLSDIRGTAQLTGITDKAFALLSAPEFGAHPSGWPEEQSTNTTVLLFHFTNNTTTANDYSPLGNNGTVYNGTMWNTSGRFGGAFTFDGIDDAIDAGAGTTLDISSSLSVSAWVYLHNLAPAGNAALVCKINDAGTDATNSYCLQQGSAGGLRFGVNGSYVNYSAGANAWHHVAGVFDDAANQIRLYVNGTQVNATTYSGAGPVTTNSLAIGGGKWSTSRFNGSIDEVVVFNRSLSADEILNLSQPERRLDRIGLRSRAYRFWIVVNNTQAAYRNQSLGVSNLPAEYVSVNLANVATLYTIHSVNVYDPNNNTVAHQQMGTNITFIANISANTAQTYTILFDDDGIYANRSVSVTGTDNLTETVHPYEILDVVDYQALRALNATNGTLVGNATGFGGFNITLHDTNSSADVFSFGLDVPRRGDVVALQRFVVFLNATGGLRPGRLTVRAW